MERSSIMVPADVHARLRLIAAERGGSMASVIREALDERIARDRPLPRSLGIGASRTSGTTRRAAMSVHPPEHGADPRHGPAVRVALSFRPGSCAVPGAHRVGAGGPDRPLARPGRGGPLDGPASPSRSPRALLGDITAGAYMVEDLTTSDYERIRTICDRYADADIGFVDAAVLAIVERLDEPKLATLDRRALGLLCPPPAEARGV